MLSVISCCISRSLARSQHQPRCHLVLSKLGSRQQQSRHVRAGNQQQQPNGRHQNPQRFRKPLAQERPALVRLRSAAASLADASRGLAESPAAFLPEPAASSFIASRNNGSMRAAAVAAVTPGRSRPMMKNAARSGQVSTSYGVPVMAYSGRSGAIIFSGTETSTGWPGCRPKNSGGVTPMTVKG